MIPTRGLIATTRSPRPPSTRLSTGRSVCNVLFEYPSVSRLDLLVVVLVKTRLFEPMSLVECPPGCVGYLYVKVYAVNLRSVGLRDRVQQRFHHLGTHASRPIWLRAMRKHVIFTCPGRRAGANAPPRCPSSSDIGKCALWARTPIGT